MSDEKTVVAESPTESVASTSARSVPVLLQYDGGAAGKRFLLNQKHITIGRRADKVEVWIDDASVSREHCSIEFKDGRATVTDLGSLNHTFINDRQIDSSAELCHSDMLKVGNVRLRYFAQGSTDQLLFDRIYRMAVTDRMLDIFRRDYLLERIDEEFRLSKASGVPLALLFLDLDKFKAVNDTFGHDAGDFVLKETCNTIRPVLRATDIFGRYGGEELCVLMPRTQLADAIDLAEKMRSLVERTVFDYEGTVIPVTVSIGVAGVAPEMATPADFLKVADGFVYMSKKNGRNRVSSPPS